MAIFLVKVPTDERGAERLANALGEDDEFAANALDAAEISPGKWALSVFFPAAPSEATLDRLGAIAHTALGELTSSLALERLPDIDWVAKSLADLKPVHVGRFFVHGQHDRQRIPANAIAIEIEANRAFGTGHHGTTAGCLAALGTLAAASAFTNVLDLGTGTGVLAIAAARLWHCPVLASDIDPTSVRLAAENIRQNSVGSLATAIPAAGFRHPAFRARAPFDLVVANILAGPLVALATDLVRHLAPGGCVVLSGLLPAQRRLIEATYTSRGLRLVRRTLRDGWLTIVFAKRRRPQAPPRVAALPRSV
ncbi:MAG: 50S ribosomal protein L11 methyltransferase [Bauldia sp.]